MPRATWRLPPSPAPDTRWAAAPSAAIFGLLLALLLATSTPLGTGHGVHAGQLLESLLPHLHIVDGRLVLHDGPDGDQDAQAPVVRPLPPPQAGPAIGAGSGADAADGGMGLSPTLPGGVLVLPLAIARYAREAGHSPLARPAEAPPTPPPTVARTKSGS